MYKYKVEVRKIRRCVEEACLEIFKDENISDNVYRKIMYSLENYIFDECEKEVE